jgi:phosphoglycerate dehydrogenase-like enzyme
MHPSEKSLESMIQDADFVSLHIPASKENADFIDKKMLSLMKKDCVLINTARGTLVNEAALYERLISSDMRAAFDVFWQEPYSGILSTLPKDKFFMTPHISSETREFIEAGFFDIKKIISEGR